MIYDVLIIGAGQAGLSMGYYLKKSSLSFIIIDNHKRVGDVWRNRYDSLVLFTPRSYSSLHGLRMEGDPDGFPTKNEVADYLEIYAETFQLPIRLDTKVQQVYKSDKYLNIVTQNSTLQAKKVVIATGPFHHPRIPAFSKELQGDIIQLHSSQYKNPIQLKEGNVLVVGGGNSGAQIAVEISKSHPTYLSAGGPLRFFPLTFANKSIFWWLDQLGILKANSTSKLAKWLRRKGDPIFGLELKEKIKLGKVSMKGRTIGITQNEILFADDSTLKIDNIIWATGFETNFSMLDFPQIFDEKGKIIHERGISNIDGLYFLGLPWQHRRGSALLLGVGDDAKFLFEKIIMDYSLN